MFLLLVCFLEKQDPNPDSTSYNHRTYEVGQEIGESFPDGPRVEQIWVAEHWSGQCASNSWSKDRSVKNYQLCRDREN